MLCRRFGGNISGLSPSAWYHLDHYYLAAKRGGTPPWQPHHHYNYHKLNQCPNQTLVCRPPPFPFLSVDSSFSFCHVFLPCFCMTTKFQFIDRPSLVFRSIPKFQFMDPPSVVFRMTTKFQFMDPPPSPMCKITQFQFVDPPSLCLEANQSFSL